MKMYNKLRTHALKVTRLRWQVIPSLLVVLIPSTRPVNFLSHDVLKLKLYL